MASPLSSPASEIKEKPEWQQFLHDKTDDAAILIYDLKNDRYLVYNRTRAEQRFSPCSTFKIPNSLISLEAGSIKDTDTDIVKWDGIERDLPEWNKDQTLRSAYAASAVWVYQELARRTGEDKMNYYMSHFKYGNSDISGGIDKFWLESSLEINAFEQIDFLRSLYAEDTKVLPFSKSNIAKVKDIMVNEKGKEYVLRAKTGYGPDKQHIGWFVGWLELKGNPYFFAMNMNMTDMKQAPYRKEIVKAALTEVTGNPLNPIR